ncbi:serine/threonine protein kinase [Oceanobacillus bengalensis]|uniref:Serine/threonine-protein kinase n=1 Tax=Oceanobacillus bengalensis TaxID=1435466 RepID=A0A494YXI4_9BACI|nr:protein kinase [Oceanobacillus bengalensis]RKQ14926.1 serine/threonine-protein kinase [Oceanobacillus bengalensis]
MRVLRKIYQFIVDKPLTKNTIIHERYVVVKLIGKGSYGIVYLCNDLQENERRILKQLRPSKRNKSEEVDLFQQEVNILSHLQHRNMPTLYDNFSEEGNYFFVMNHIEGYNLDKVIFTNKEKYSEKDSLLLFSKLLELIENLHSQGIYHLDLRLPNILLHHNEVFLIDFGLARMQSDVRAANKMILQDFYDLGDILLFLLYTTFSTTKKKALPWTEELSITKETTCLLKRLLSIDEPYSNITEICGDLTAALEAID